jgi:hypothetical protein
METKEETLEISLAEQSIPAMMDNNGIVRAFLPFPLTAT